MAEDSHITSVQRPAGFVRLLGTIITLGLGFMVRAEEIALPIDPLALYFKALGVEGDKAEAFDFQVKGKPVRVSTKPILTIRDVESARLLRQQESDPKRVRAFSGDLKLTEWGSRRRARAIRGIPVGVVKNLATVTNGQLSSYGRVFGTPMSRSERFGIVTTLDGLADYDEKFQDALKAFHEQPIVVHREPGEYSLGPGWKIVATREAGGVRLGLEGPERPDGDRWHAGALLPGKENAPFVVCWESKWCVLWAASAETLVGIRFQPNGTPEVVSGELEETLRMQDAPASVRKEIQRVFPLRDGDPATHVGSISGAVILAGKPAANVEVQVFTHFDKDDHDGESFKVKSGADGRFEIPKVRAPAQVQISMNVINIGQMMTSGPSLAFHAHVDRDQKLECTLGGEGRPVIGKIVDPQNEGRDWSKSTVEFVLVPPVSQTVEELRARRSAVTAEGYEQFLKTEQGRPYALGPQRLGRDGTFNIPRVPAAAYWIYVNTEDGKVRRRVKCLRMRMFADGKTDEKLDLGSFPMKERDVSPISY